MPDSNHPFTGFIWPLLASLAGALTALSFRPFKDMTRSEITLAMAVGTSFAMFVGPLAAWWIFGTGPVDFRIFGGVLYLMASGSNILIPLAVRKLGQLFGVKNEEAGK